MMKTILHGITSLCAVCVLVTSCTGTALPPPPLNQWEKIKTMPVADRPMCKKVDGTVDIIGGYIWTGTIIGAIWGIPEFIHGMNNKEISQECERYNMAVFNHQ